MDRILFLNSITSDQYTKSVLYCQQKDANFKLLHFTFQRDKNTDDGKEVYIYYHTRGGTEAWYLTNGLDFKAKNTSCWMYLDSSGKK